jgi:hypothetical protein
MELSADQLSSIAVVILQLSALLTALGGFVTAIFAVVRGVITDRRNAKKTDLQSIERRLRKAERKIERDANYIIKLLEHIGQLHALMIKNGMTPPPIPVRECENEDDEDDDDEAAR